MNIRDFTTLFRVTLRRQRWAFAAWVGSFCCALAVLPKAYQSNMGSMELRKSIIDMMNSNGGTRLLFGTVPQPGTIGQVIQWETALLLMIFTAVAVVFIVTTAGRRGEDDGLRELVEGIGVSRTTVFAVQAASGLVFSAAVGFFCGLVLAVQVPIVSEISVSGAACLGLTLFLVGCAFSAVALVFSQLSSDAVGARRLSLLSLFLAFTLRVVAEASGWLWIRWLTPMGWKELLRPFTDNRFPIAIPMVAIVGSLSVLAWRLYAGRELHGAYLRSTSRSNARLRTTGILTLALHLGRRRLAGWLIGTIAMAAFVGSMADSFVTLTENNANYSDLIGKMAEGGDTASKVIAIFSVLIGILVICETASAIAFLADTEKRGILDIELASGASRRNVLAAQAATAAIEAAILTAAGAAALALTVGMSLNWTSGREVAWLTLTQWPAAVCLIGIGSLFYAISRSMAALVWAVVGWSFALSWFGEMLDLPRWILDATILGWSVSPGNTEHLPQAASLLALGLVASVLATGVYSRRDIAG